MKLPLPTRARRTGDDMLPLVNIVFLLLIFFMLAGAVSTPDPLNVQPPQSMVDAAGDRLPSMLVVGADGRLALGREVFTLEGLAPRIDAWLAVAPPGFPLTVKADAETEALAIVTLLEALKRQGVTHVRLMTARVRAA